MQNELNEYYINLLKEKYIGAPKSLKSSMLDDAQVFTKLSRKTIIKRLNIKFKKDKLRINQGRPRKYDHLIPHLRMLKNLMGNISEKRIKAAIPIWLDYYAEHFNLVINSKVYVDLKRVSPSTIARLLKMDLGTKGLSTTKPSKKFKNIIPIKRLDEEVTAPGTVQTDTVAHCGTMIAGKYCNTITSVDVYTGWTENRAIWTKDSKEVVKAIRSIEEAFPFRLKNFDTDCGSEFLNINVMKYLEERPAPVKMRRARPYKKNDQCYVEQKNFTHVRKLFKYHRLECPKLVTMMNDIYENYWNPLHNYFIPSFKLESKERVDSKIKKIHEFPKTPAARITCNKSIDKHVRNRVISESMRLDPVLLKKELNKKLALFLEELENYNSQIAA